MFLTMFFLRYIEHREALGQTRTQLSSGTFYLGKAIPYLTLLLSFSLSATFYLKNLVSTGEEFERPLPAVSLNYSLTTHFNNT